MKDQSFSIVPFVVLVVIMAILLGLLSISQSLCTLVAAWLLPTIVVTIIDDKPGRYLLSLIAIFNFAGVTPAIIRLIKYRNDIDIIVDQVLSDKEAWLFAYAYSACGWMVYNIVPSIAETLYKTKLRDKIAVINQQIAVMKDEWGIDETEAREQNQMQSLSQHRSSSQNSQVASKSKAVKKANLGNGNGNGIGNGNRNDAITTEAISDQPVASRPKLVT